ncbi:hydratase [uncultured Sulfitobacter sp.]|uniref:2-keto-4-pentenoate hydratase n=1 Tax=uncultured Sulfitobacter sp. TaxID=191468 RepID=UPI00260DE16F|nr:hydratase [uncultured Sulfitobacter sp.]
MHRFILCLTATLALPTGAFAKCATEAEIAAFVAAASTNTPAKALAAGGSMDDALCTQDKLVAAMAPTMGRVIGYKAGLTSKPAQDRFGVSEPVQGVLYENMMVEDGATVPVAFGAIPMVESDLVLKVGSTDINSAQTPLDVLSAISSVHPFIELPDMTLAKGEPINAVTLTAIGVAPKLGVLGAGIPVTDAAAMTDALSSMSVTLTNGAGEDVTTAPGKAVLGHPANAVLWLVSKGIALQEGDLVSVGSFGPLTPAAKMKGGASVTYQGLPGDPTVSVTFSD